MTWSISASGTKSEVIEKVRAATCGDSSERRQFDRMKVVIEQEIMRIPDHASSVSVSASGHSPGDEGGSRSTSISVTATVPAKLKTPGPNDATVSASGTVT